jgi:hypothetical protein
MNETKELSAEKVKYRNTYIVIRNKNDPHSKLTI